MPSRNIPKELLYPEIDRPQGGPIVGRAPCFPHQCPICHAARIGLAGVGTKEAVAIYSCAGQYRRSESRSKASGRNVWWGSCGGVKPASEAVGLKGPSSELLAGLAKAKQSAGAAWIGGPDAPPSSQS